MDKLMSPPAMTEGEIIAQYVQMRNRGQNTVHFIDGYMSLDTWRDRELAKIGKVYVE